MLNAPRCVPIYRHGRLEHFADMRGFILDRALVSRCTDTEGGSARDFANTSVEARPHCPGAAPLNPATQIITGLEGRGRPFNLDACFKMGEGVER